jgi:hypothetical protein
MAKQQYTWSVRGISSDARKRAKKSSGKRRVTIGEWLSLALIALANEELAAAPNSLAPIGPSQAVADAAGLGDRERALLALATRPPPATTKAELEQQAPWSVRGVSQVARVKVAQAAAHRRVTIGEWVNHAIITYSDREAGIETPRPVVTEAPLSEEQTEKTMQLVEALARHIDDTGSAMAPPHDLSHETRPLESQPPTPAAPAVTAEISELSNQVKQSEARNGQRITPLTSAMTPPPDLTHETRPSKSQPPTSAAPAVTAKISELSNQVKQSEARNEQRITTLTSALTVFADRLKLTSGTGQPAADPAPQAGPAEAAPGPMAKTVDHMSKTELAFWETINDSDDPSDYQVYLETYPNGVFAPLARKRLHGEEPTAAPAAAAKPGDAATRRRPPVTSYPKLDYETLNQRAIENTRRLNPDKE